MTREDTRSNNQLRDYRLKQIDNNKSITSTYLEVGASRIICSLYSGYSLDKRVNLSEECEILVTIEDIENDNLSAKFSSSNADTSMFVKRALESVVCIDEYQKIYFEFVFEILNKEDGILSHLMNLACYTMLKANVMIKDVFSCSEGVWLGEGQVLMDPTDEERKKAGNFALMCKLKDSNEVCAFKLQGIAENKVIEEVMSYLYASCNVVGQMLINCN
jgi:ribonuclease PH